MPRYIVYDAVSRRYLAQLRKPVKELDVAVTEWAESEHRAMKFKVYAAASSAVEWLEGDGRIKCTILESEE